MSVWAAGGTWGTGGPPSAILISALYFEEYCQTLFQLYPIENNEITYTKPIDVCPYKTWNNYKHIDINIQKY